MTRLATAAADLLFILIGTALLCVGAAFIHPAGPWLVAGAVSLAAGTAILVSNLRSSR